MKLPTLFLLAALFVLPGCATTGQPTGNVPPETREMLARVEMPKSIGKLSVENATAYPDPALGVAYRYVGDIELAADVYVYPIGKDLESTLIKQGEAALLEAGHQGFLEEMAWVKSQGRYDSYEIVSTDMQDATFDYTRPNGMSGSVGYKIMRAKLSVSMNGNDLASYFSLAEFHGYFVKLRVTHPGYPGFEQNIDSFFDELLQHMYSKDVGKEYISMGNEGSDKVYHQWPGESQVEFMVRALKGIAMDTAEAAPGDSR